MPSYFVYCIITIIMNIKFNGDKNNTGYSQME